MSRNTEMNPTFGISFPLEAFADSKVATEKLKLKPWLRGQTELKF